MLKKLLGSALLLFALAAPVHAADVSVDGNLRLNCGTATGSSNAATLANKCGTITTETATSAAGATFTETITDTVVAASDICMASVATSGTGTPAITRVTPASTSLVIIVQNVHASAAFNAALVISYVCFKA